MKTTWIYLALLLWFIPACSTGVSSDIVTPESIDTLHVQETSQNGDYVSWGTYDLTIARDGSDWEIVPNREAEGTWGFHLNAVKLLEVSPGHNCIKIPKIGLLSNGDLAVDISITHPYDNAVYTGFDVRGIIMFPSSGLWPNDDMRIQLDLDPMLHWYYRYSSSELGDAELMNPEGWTSIWVPEDWYPGTEYQLEEGYPIFGYYQGKFAMGEDLSTLNAFIRFHSNEARHMFEINKTVTRTYVIHPPADGPIQASYIVYAHWAEPNVIPVTDPESDFPPEANSPMPYEFWVYQDQVLDPDAPETELGQYFHWHIKTWDIGYEHWGVKYWDLPFTVSSGGSPEPSPDGEPDDYVLSWFPISGYKFLPGLLPGDCTYIFRLEIFHPDGYNIGTPLASDYYMADIAIGEFDGEW